MLIRYLPSTVKKIMQSSTIIYFSICACDNSKVMEDLDEICMPPLTP